MNIVDDDTYDGDIPLEETKVIGTAGEALQTTGNPFAKSYFYLSPDIKIMMDSSLEIVQNSGDTNLVNKIKFVQRQPSAIWMDSIDTISGNPDAGRRSLIEHLDSAVAQQNFFAEQNGGVKAPMTIVVIIYNLPDRDCAAYASNGKLIQVGQKGVDYSQWEYEFGQGYNIYRDQYIKPIAQAFADPKYKDLRIVAMLEPDSFPNMITNTNDTAAVGHIPNSSLNPLREGTTGASLTNGGYCDRILSAQGYTTPVEGEGTSDKPNLGIYAEGLRLAIKEFAGQDNVYTYLDIGHAGWLGWDSATDPLSNMKRGVKYFKQLVDGADGKLDGKGFDMIRGFASNTSGYTPLEEPLISSSETARELLQSFYSWNPAVDELSYIDALKRYFTSTNTSDNVGPYAFDANKLGFIIDTARNGWGSPTRPKPGVGTKGTDVSKRVDKRVHRGHWCNINKAGIGEAPRANPDKNRSHLDAFFWMKPPGESDGISFKTSEINRASLDDIDRKIFDDASNPVYAGKSLDTMCVPGEARENVVVDVVPNIAPHAGGWFHKQFLMLIDNAYPALGKSDYTPK